jgi:hypothetical protein
MSTKKITAPLGPSRLPINLEIPDNGKEGSARGTLPGFPSPIKSKAFRTFSKF